MNTPHDPQNRLLRFRQALDQLIEDLVPGPQDSLAGNAIPISLDVYVHPHHVEVLVDLPGVGPESVDVSATGQLLVVEGQRPGRARSPGRTLCLESPVGRFRRRLELPVPADTRRAVACLGNGVLQISVPRIEDRRGGAHKIPVIRP
ncbi:Hsp20/alpha crystallin family protein [Myxococcota bacterium]|nr:Hsp20/alpha crystallin family protein [Myxococcota bacterium]